MLLIETANPNNIEYRIYEWAYLAVHPKYSLIKGCEYFYETQTAVAEFLEWLHEEQTTAVSGFGCCSWEEVEAIEIKAYKDAEAGCFDPPAKKGIS